MDTELAVWKRILFGSELEKDRFFGIRSCEPAYAVSIVPAPHRDLAIENTSYLASFCCCARCDTSCCSLLGMLAIVDIR